MSLLAKAVLAFAERHSLDEAICPNEYDVEVPSDVWRKWLQLARVDQGAADRTRAAYIESLGREGYSVHNPRCGCEACEAQRKFPAGPLPVQPSELHPSPQREPERAAEGAARSAGERSQGAVLIFCATRRLIRSDDFRDGAGAGTELVCELAPGHDGEHRDGHYSWRGGFR